MLPNGGVPPTVPILTYPLPMRARIPSSVFWLLLVAVPCAVTGLYVAPPDVIRVGPFSEASPTERYPPDWSLYEIANGQKQTQYDLVESERGTVVRARTEGGTSSLYTEPNIDLTTHPILKWHWKIGRLAQTDIRTQRRNDITAGLVVTFDHNELGLVQRLKGLLLSILGYHIVPKRALIYFWANRVQQDSVHEGIFIDWHTKVAVRSGSTHVGTWVTERRNVLHDYRTIFGNDPPPIESIALITETSNTGEQATAYYGDLSFRTAPPDSVTVPTLNADAASPFVQQTHP